MRNTKGISIAAASLLLLALAGLWYAFHADQTAEQQLAALNREQANLEASAAKTQEQIGAHQRDAAAIAAALQAAEATKATAAATRRPAAGGQSAPSIPTLVEADPKLMDLYLKSFRANLAVRFGWVYEKIGLTPEQINKVKDLSTAHEQENMDLRAAAEAQGLTMSDPGIVKLHQQTNQQFQAAVNDAIGAAANAQFGQYTAIPDGMVSVVTDLATANALDPAPMTYAQAGQLMPIFEAARVAAQGNGGTMDWDKIANQAAGFITGPALQSLQTRAQIVQLSTLVRQYYSDLPPAK
jgi:hypothetical protein